MSMRVNREGPQEITALTLKMIIFHLSKVFVQQTCSFTWADPPHSAMPLKIPLLQGGEPRQGSARFQLGLRIYRAGTELYLECPGNSPDPLSSTGRCGDLRAEGRKRILRKQ